MPVYDYAPDVQVIGEYLYFSASRKDVPCSFYRTKNPLAEKFEKIQGVFPFWDPNLFADEDGRIYLYWGCSNTEPLYGVELDPDCMKPRHKPVKLIHARPDVQGYERTGQDHICTRSQEEIELQARTMAEQLMQAPKDFLQGIGIESEEDIHKMAYAVASQAPFLEGPWMTKKGKRYYLQYAVPGTEFNIYGDGVYVSDFPLGPFHAAENNPQFCVERVGCER